MFETNDCIFFNFSSYIKFANNKSFAVAYQHKNFIREHWEECSQYFVGTEDYQIGYLNDRTCYIGIYKNANETSRQTRSRAINKISLSFERFIQKNVWQNSVSEPEIDEELILVQRTEHGYSEERGFY